MEKAAFKLDDYYFTRASLDFNITDKAELNIEFSPKGVFTPKDSSYELNFDVKVKCKENNTEVINVSCVAKFSFDGYTSISEIPEYFYPNSLAIIFPYIRAFVSTMSLQANVRPIVLPTVNLMGLTEELKERTTIADQDLMRITDIYQTLEDRQNYKEVEEHGPYFCPVTYTNGILKTGKREPWLGGGYYFWDTRISDAHWWGNNVYDQVGYIICHTTYDQHSPLLYDLVANVNQFEEFVKCAELIKAERKVQTVKFPIVLSYLKNKAKGFNFKAIRVWPHPNTFKKTAISFPNNKLFLEKAEKIQICFFDKTLLTSPYKIVYRKAYAAEQTI